MNTLMLCFAAVAWWLIIQRCRAHHGPGLIIPTAEVEQSLLVVSACIFLQKHHNEPRFGEFRTLQFEFELQ